MLFLYHIIIFIITAFSPVIIFFRILKNKEDKKRYIEKFSISSKKRVKGKLIWFHGASVGEILSIVPLIKNYEKNNSISQILVTSSTLSSSKVLKKFKFKKTVHQFYPIDNLFLTNKFLKFWKPCMAVFVDSEIWPCMYNNINNQKIPLILLNARITKKTSRLGEALKQIVFKVDISANKREIRKAVEMMFKVEVIKVTTSIVKGKTKRNRFGIYKRSNYKKAFVSISENSDIQFEGIN